VWNTFHSIEGELEDDTKTLVVSVKPGWKAGTKITFPSEGDEGPKGLPADLVFVVKEKPHPALTREGNHLVVAKKVCVFGLVPDFTWGEMRARSFWGYYEGSSNHSHHVPSSFRNHSLSFNLLLFTLTSINSFFTTLLLRHSCLFFLLPSTVVVSRCAHRLLRGCANP